MTDKTPTPPRVIRRAREELRLDLPGGGAIFYRIATSMDHDAAEANGGDMLRHILGSTQALSEFGMTEQSRASLIKAVGDKGVGVMRKTASSLYAVGLGLSCITRLEGLSDETGADLKPVTADLYLLFSDDDIQRLFLSAVLKPLHEAIEVGNGSASASDGNSGSEPKSAPNAKASPNAPISPDPNASTDSESPPQDKSKTEPAPEKGQNPKPK